MRRLLKILALTLISLIVLVALALVVLTQLINPNDYKPQIQQLAKENANLNLDIKGDLGWTFWPSLGVSIGATDARIGDSKELFAGIQQVDASVAVWPLLFGDVQVDGLAINGLKLHLVQTKDGANWEQLSAASSTPAQPATAAPATPAANDQAPLTLPVVIPQVSITDASISYDDNTSATHLSVNHINLKAQNVNLKDASPFPLEASLRYQDAANRVDLALKAQVSLDLAHNHYRLAPMTLDAKIAGATPKPVDVHLEQTVDANLDTGIVALTDLVLNAAGTHTSGQVSIAGLNDNQLVFSGKLDTAPFNANDALKAIGEAPIATSDATALSKVAASLTLKGPANSVMVNPLKLTLDNSTLTGKAGLASLDSGKIVFDLALDKITLDGYLPPVDTTAATEADKSAAQTASGAATGGTSSVSQNSNEALSTAPLLPLDTLRSLLVDGKLRIGELHYAGINGKDLQLNVSAAQGKLDASTQGALMDGNFTVQTQLDASGKTPQMSASGKLSNMQIQPAAKLALEDDLLKGILSADLSGKAAGNSEQALMDSATGQLNMELKDGTVRGANLHGALVAGVNDLLGKYQGLLALLPKAQKLPPALSTDTKIVDLTASGALAKQVVSLSQIKAQLDKGNLNGTGWMNLNNDDFEFILGMQSPEFSDSPYLKDTNWPIRCAGNLDSDPKRWCGPDRKGLDDIAQQAMAKAASKKIADKLGIDAEGDTTKEVIQNATKDKAKEELKKQLNKLFN